MNNKPQLKPKYYLDNFEYLLNFVIQKYKPILSDNELTFISVFSNMHEDSRALYVRLINRRKRFFQLQDLDYPEINDINLSLSTAEVSNLVNIHKRFQNPINQDILHVFSKQELIKFASLKKVSNLSKNALIELIILEYSEHTVNNLHSNNISLIEPRFLNEVEFFKFLFFGDLDSEMSKFVIQDIGNAYFEDYDISKLKAAFISREEADEKYTAYKTYSKFRELRETLDANSLFTWIVNNEEILKPHNENVQVIYDKLLKRAGSILEKSKFTKEALELYSHCKVDKSRERIVTLLKKEGDIQNAMQVAEEILTNPANSDEYIFANDFKDRIILNKSKKATRLLNEADAIEISNSFINQVELGALAYYQNVGYNGFFSENYVWCSFLGLVLWDFIFDKKELKPFQITPESFFMSDFYSRNNNVISKQFSKLCIDKNLRRFIEKKYFEKFGILNPLVYWEESLLTKLNIFIDNISAPKIILVLEEMLKNLKRNTKGFPDLFIYKNGSYKFAEIKSPNDHLSNQQVYWFEFFKRIGIESEVIRVRFK
jgi:hypothetical protein